MLSWWNRIFLSIFSVHPSAWSLVAGVTAALTIDAAREAPMHVGMPQESWAAALYGITTVGLAVVSVRLEKCRHWTDPERVENKILASRVWLSGWAAVSLAGLVLGTVLAFP